MADFSNWEKTYWKLRFVQFRRKLQDNSGEPLVLPETFVENVTEKLAKNVTLKTATGSEWTIGLETGRDGNLFLRDGWKEFVKSHYLKKNDTLIFKYTGDSKFDVTMFDGDTSIEKACGHFVHNALHVPVTEIHQNDRNGQRRAEYNRGAAHDDDSDSELLLTRNKKKAQPTGNSSSARTRTRGDYSDDHSGHLSKEMDTKLQYPGCHDNPQPNRRTATHLLKKQGTDEDVLEVYMQPSYVHPTCFVCMSKRWALKHNIVKSQDLLLHRDGKTWEVVFYIRKTTAGIGKAGWKAFLNENSVEEGDRCYFSVVPGSRDPITLDVRIVRADGVKKEEESWLCRYPR